jgi:hypothetical protein
MAQIVVRRTLVVTLAQARRVGALALAFAAIAAPLEAQRLRRGSRPMPWSVLLTGGGSYAISDLEIAPGTDQHGGWAWDAGLRLQRGVGALGVGFERTRFDLGGFGHATTSNVFIEPRLAVGLAARGVRPYVFARAARVVDYDVKACCSVYPIDRNAAGWQLGGGFGFTTPPVGLVRFDLGASASRLSGESEARNNGAWKGAGPLLALRLGASVPLVGGW